MSEDRKLERDYLLSGENAGSGVVVGGKSYDHDGGHGLREKVSQWWSNLSF